MNCAVSSTGVVTNSFQHLWMKESLPTAVRFHSTALASGDQHFQHGSAANAIAKGWLTSDAPGFQGRSNIYIYEEIYSLGLVPGDTEAKAGQGFFSLLVRVCLSGSLLPQLTVGRGTGHWAGSPPSQPVLGLLYFPVLPGLEHTPPAETLTAQKQPKGHTAWPDTDAQPLPNKGFAPETVV